MKNKKIIISLLIMCLVLIIVLMTVKKSIEDNSVTVVEELGSVEVEMTEYSVNMENFDEVLELLPMKSITMRDRIQNFAIEFIKKMYSISESDEEEIEQLFEANNTYISSYLYECDLEDFKTLIKELSNMNDSITFSNSVLDVNSFESNDSEMTFNLTITYNDEYDFKFVVHIPQQGDIDETDITFEII